jgi:pimeloyl-ACP methyl ester carboxylesterase
MAMNPEVPVVLSAVRPLRSRIDLALRSYAEGVLFAEVFGEGTPRVLALHGWARRGQDFAISLDGIPAIAPDLPGFGATPPPADAIGAHGYAEIVSRLLPEFERPPVVVGHSFGGRVAVCLAASRPGEVGPLLLTGVPLLRRQSQARPALSYRLFRALNRWGVVSDERLDKEKRRRGSADYRAASGVMRDVLVRVVNEGYSAELTKIRSEVTLIWGEKDREVPVTIAREAYRILDEAGVPVRLDVVEGVGHHLPVERPERLRSVVEEML